MTRSVAVTLAVSRSNGRTCASASSWHANRSMPVSKFKRSQGTLGGAAEVRLKRVPEGIQADALGVLDGGLSLVGLSHVGPDANEAHAGGAGRIEVFEVGDAGDEECAELRRLRCSGRGAK